MIQDIYPSRLDNSFRAVQMEENDLLFPSSGVCIARG